MFLLYVRFQRLLDVKHSYLKIQIPTSSGGAKLLFSACGHLLWHAIHCVYMLYIINAVLYNQANAIILQKYGLGEVKQCNYIPFDSEDIFFLGHTSLDPAIFHAISLP